jgi:hypothetical protein
MRPVDSLKYLAEAFDKELSEARIGIYLHELRDCDPGILAVAAQHLVRTKRWFPTIADLLDAYDLQATKNRKALPPAGPPHAVLDGVDHVFVDGRWVRSDEQG